MSALPARGFKEPEYDWAGPANDNDGGSKVLTFKPVGPVARAFVNDRSFISTIMGPYGSAKTTSCFQKILNCVIWQNRGPDGVRRIRVCVIRQTYGQLATNVIADWLAWFPKTKANFNGEENKHTLTIDFPGLDGPGTTSRCVIEMLFRGLGELKAEAVFKGMALTLLWLNEVDTLDMDVLKYGIPRVGRFPSSKDGGCAWSGVIADMNAPEVDNWTYDLLVLKKLDIPDALLEKLRATYGADFKIEFWRQPGGQEPGAENLDNLPEGYYDRLCMAFNDNEKRRFVDNEFGAVNNGQPVYPEFKDRVHVATGGMKPLPGVPITLGVDGGMTPAVVFLQEDELGRVLVLTELVVMAANDNHVLARLGPTNFGNEVKTFFEKTFPGHKMGDIWGDPAGFEGGDDEDLAWMLKFGKALGKKVRSAPGTNGNRITPRLDAVRGLMVDKERQVKLGLLVSDACVQLRRGFNSGYVLIRVKFSNGSGRTKDEPLKNDYSHVHDALQYGVLGLKKRGNAANDDGRDDQREKLRRAQAGVYRGTGYFSGEPGARVPQPRRTGRAR